MAAGRPGIGAATGTLAMSFVGGSVAVSAVVAGAPVLTGQGVRYAAASCLLLAAARALRVPITRPRGADWLWLLGVTVLGLVVFNLALVYGARHAEPAVYGVAVASVPILLALLGPLLGGEPPRTRVLAAALVVTAGAVLVQGFGRTDAVGLLYAITVLLCEAGFTLLAVPVLARRGAWSVSVHTTWMGAAVFAVLGLAVEGGSAVGELDARHWAALAYLAIAVTAVAFVLWYSAVRSLGPGRAGLLTGIAPVAAILAGVLLGGPLPGPPVWAGTFVVAAGLAIGLGGRRGRRNCDLARPVPVTTSPSTSCEGA